MIFGAGPVPFIACFGVGTGMGILYIILRFCLRKLKCNKVLRNIFDFLFVVVTALFYFLACYLTLEGQFRLFTLVALFIGFGASFLLIRLFRKLLDTLKKKRKTQL